MEIQEIRDEIRALDARNLTLWFALVLVMFAVSIAFIWLVLPRVLRQVSLADPGVHYRPEVLFGVIALILLFNFYMAQRRRLLYRARDEMVRELVRAEAGEMLTLLDPVTELFNRRFLDRFLPKEVSNADRNGSVFTVALFDIADFRSANQRLGSFAADGILVDVAKLLTRTFRPSDLVIRFGGDEFLVLMSGTDEAAARCAIERLIENVAAWNRERASKNFHLRLGFGLATYTRGDRVTAVLGAAEASLYANRFESPALGAASAAQHAVPAGIASADKS